MHCKWIPKPRFSLSSVFVLFLGVAIGYTLSLQTLRRPFGPASEARMSRPPEYRVSPPDTLYIEVGDSSDSMIKGPHTVLPDGTIRLAAFGQILVAGKTIREIEETIRGVVSESSQQTPIVFASVQGYNSKFYYVIVDRPDGKPDSVLRFPIKGRETVLDAIAEVGDLNALTRSDVSLSRPSRTLAVRRIDIDLDSIVRGESINNYQLMPGDRLFVSEKSPATNPVAVR